MRHSENILYLDVGWQLYFRGNALVVVPADKLVQCIPVESANAKTAPSCGFLDFFYHLSAQVMGDKKAFYWQGRFQPFFHRLAAINKMRHQ